ncbi:MAG: sensor histidine kinase [Acidimicrobiales bacterium]
MKRWARRALGAVRRHPLTADSALACVFGIAALVSAASLVQYLDAANPGFEPPNTTAIVLSMLLITAPLALRRRFPLTTAVAAVGGFLLAREVLNVEEMSITVLAGSFALYSAAAHGNPRWRTPVLALCVSLIAGDVALKIYFGAPEVRGQALTQGFTLFYNIVLLAFPWALGAAVRTLRRQRAELAQRAGELEREREQNARRAVFEERVRIARELHDVVAHHVSVMGVQAGAARTVIHRQPDKAVEALASIEAASRQAVGELHGMLGFLRREGEVDDMSPQPRLAELPDLVRRVAQADLEVELSVEGECRPLPRTVEVSAYRIVQEALTNTVKHAGATTARVWIRYGSDSLRLEVLDDGPGNQSRPQDKPGGHGLIGMRERVSLHGGELRAGPRPEGGFGVEATLPLAGR